MMKLFSKKIKWWKKQECSIFILKYMFFNLINMTKTLHQDLWVSSIRLYIYVFRHNQCNLGLVLRFISLQEFRSLLGQGYCLAGLPVKCGLFASNQDSPFWKIISTSLSLTTLFLGKNTTSQCFASSVSLI